MPFIDSSVSRVRIMDECGSSGVAGTEIVNSPDGYEYDFGIILAQGGQYEVCWCIGIEPYVGCALNNHFGVRVAELVLDGPSGGAIYTCVRGTLIFQILVWLFGAYLSQKSETQIG